MTEKEIRNILPISKRRFAMSDKDKLETLRFAIPNMIQWYKAGVCSLEEMEAQIKSLLWGTEINNSKGGSK